MSDENNTDEVYLTRNEVAKKLGMSLRSVDSLLYSGVLPSIRFSQRCRRIPWKRAQAELAKLETGGIK